MPQPNSDITTLPNEPSKPYPETEEVERKNMPVLASDSTATPIISSLNSDSVTNTLDLIKKMPMLAPFTLTNTFEEKLQIIDALNTDDDRRRLNFSFILPIFYFEKEQNMAAALEYSKLKLYNATLISEELPTDDLWDVKEAYLADANSDIGQIMSSMGKYVEAQKYYELALDLELKALQIRKINGIPESRFNQLFASSPPIVRIYNSLANVHRDLGNIQKYLEYKEQASNLLFAFEPNEDNKNLFLINIYLEMSRVFNMADRKHLVIEFGLEALWLAKKLFFIRSNIETPRVNSSLSNVCNGLNLHYTALDFLHQNLDINLGKGSYASSVGSKGRPPINAIVTYGAIAETWEALEDYEQAYHFYEKALDLAIESKAENKDPVDPSVIWSTYQYMASNKDYQSTQVSNTSEKITLLQEALNHSEKAIELIESTRKEQNLEKSSEAELVKSSFLKNKISIFDSAIDICIKLQSLTRDVQYVNKAYELVERSKSQVFFDLVTDKGIDQVNIDSVFNIKNLSLHLKRESATLLEYYLTNKGIYIFMLSGSGQVNLASYIFEEEQNDIKSLEAFFDLSQQYKSIVSTPNTDIQDINKLGYNLYSLLIPESFHLEFDNDKNLIFVPSNFLHDFPFHILPYISNYIGELTNVVYYPSAKLAILDKKVYQKCILKKCFPLLIRSTIL